MDKVLLRQQLERMSPQELIDKYEAMFVEACPRVNEELVIKAIMENRPIRKKKSDTADVFEDNSKI